jgi:Peptidase family M28
MSDSQYINRTAALSLVLVVLSVVVSIRSLNPPAAAGLDAPATEFSAARAMKHLQVIARSPHPVGTAEHEAVREYIAGELRSQGLEPEIQEATAVTRRPTLFHAGTVRNVLALLLGTGTGKAILLAAHYDSVSRGPGASDDGAAVAALLETLRALKAGPPLHNDVIFLFTDGEEASLLGARAFVAEHPWARRVGLALNYDARGTSGPVIMFETSAGNGWLIKEFGKAAPHPVASSLSYDLYKLLPNDTDMSTFKAAQFPGLNFAFIDGYLNYHSPFDNLERVDQNTLQHEGSSALALTRHFGNLDLTKAHTPDATYFDLLGRVLIWYPQVWNVVLTILVTVLFMAALGLGIKKGELSIGKVGLGALAFLVSAVCSVLLIGWLWNLIRIIHPGYRLLPAGQTYNNNLYLIGFVMLAIAIVATLYVFYLKLISTPNLILGALLCWVPLAILDLRFFPGGNYLLVWPLLFSLCAIAFWFVSKERWSRWLALSLGGVPGLIILTPLIYMIFLSLGWRLITGVMAAIMLALSLLIPQLCLMLKRNKYVLPMVALLVGLGFVVAGGVRGGFNKQHPKPNVIFYGLNGDTGTASWMSTDFLPDEWTSQFFSANFDGNLTAEFLPFFNTPVLSGPAPAVQLPSPTMQVLGDNTNDSVRTISMRIASARQAPALFASVGPETEVIEAAVNGMPLESATTENGWCLRYFGPPAGGVQLTLKVRSDQPLELRLIDQSYKLPDLPIRPRPDYMQPGIFFYSDTTLVTKAFKL